MPKISAGLLIYRSNDRGLEVLLVHPGGPFWRNKDHGSWSIPKGEAAGGEALFAVAQREFQEETGASAHGPTIFLGEVRQHSGKRVHAWAVQCDFDPAALTSNSFELEWPARSGRKASFPEVDRAEWFAIPEARQRIIPAQEEFLDRLGTRLLNAG